MEFEIPTGGVVRSANITPSTQTGIGDWSEDAFVAKFKSYSDSSIVNLKIGKNEFNSEMPWTQYAQMKEEDLRAIYAYLQTLEPIEHEVETFTAGK
jgi:hypothetical protein